MGFILFWEKISPVDAFCLVFAEIFELFSVNMAPNRSATN